MKRYISTNEIIEKGNELNKLHAAYKDSTPKEKASRWQESFAAWTEYQHIVHCYIETKPADISDLL